MPCEGRQRALGRACVTFALALMVVFGTSCGDSSPTGGSGDDFSFSVTVVDGRDAPMPGLLVSVFNVLPDEFFDPDRSRFTTRFDVTVAEPAHVTLEAYDLDGELFSVVLDEPLGAGAHSQSFSGTASECPFGTRVFEMQCVARDTAYGGIVFRDSVYAVYWNVFDPSQCVVGVTSDEGTFETTDRLLFPHLFDLPPLTITNVVSPESQGVFNIPDEVRIAVCDTTGGQDLWTTTTHVVEDGDNEFTVVWDPDRAVAVRPWPGELAGAAAVPLADVDVGDPVRHEWELSQNYPNPFN